MKWIIFTQALLAFVTSSACSLYLETFHSGIWKVPEDTDNTLNISLRFNASSETERDLETPHDLGALLVVTVVPDEDWKLYFVNSSAVFTGQEVRDEVVKNITFSGYYWGLTQLSFYLTRNDLDSDFKNRTLLRDDLQVVIDRRSKVVDNIFIAVASVFVLFNNINMGAQLDIKLIWGVLKKPVGPICGLLSQFICMPTVTWIMGSLLFTDTLQRLGLFTYGCCPGGTSSNFWTLMFNGDLNLSITMTTVSFVAAMGMMPLWMFTLGSRLMDGEDTIVIPFSNLAISLLALSLPICVGIIVRLKRPAWADNGKKILKPCILFVLIFFLTAGIYNSYKVFMLMNWHMILAGVFVVITGYTFGALFAKVMCLERPQVIAVSIETAMQNTGVAAILLKLSLESPFSDLASIPIFATFFVTGPPLFFVYFSCKMIKRLRNHFGFGDAEKDPQVERPDSPETASFLPRDEGTAKDEGKRDNCSKREEDEDSICSIKEENKNAICTIREENEEVMCSTKEENRDAMCILVEGNEDTVCIKEENKDAICTVSEENEDSICSIKEENGDSICTIQEENEDSICSIKEENEDTKCTIKEDSTKGEDEEDIGGAKADDREDNQTIITTNMEDNSNKNDEHVEDDQR